MSERGRDTVIRSPWNAAGDDSVQTSAVSVMPQSAVSGENSLTPGLSSSMESQPVSSDSISTALMTAFDLDSQHTSLMEGQTPAGVSTYPTYTYTDPIYSDRPYGDQSYPNHTFPDQPYADMAGLAMGCSSSFLSPPPSVEQQTSQRSTPCPDNESGYITMEEQDLQSPANMYWPQHHHQHYTSTIDDLDNSFSNMNTVYPATVSSYGEGGGYPYTHQDSQYQTLHQTASTSSSSSSSSDIIYYPFNDLMQLNPNLLGTDPDMSIQYVQTNPYSQQSESCSDPYLHSAGSRKRGRGGRPRGGRQCPMGQIQSDQISSSLQRQLQAQMGAPPKRQYRRRNPESRKKSLPKIPRCSVLEGGEKRGRHNEPLNQRAVDIMNEWYRQHEDNPYPSKDEKEEMAMEGGITTMQVKSWFANKRNRSNNTRPKVQKRAMEEKLMQIYNQLSRTEGASVQEGGNSFIIKELSQIINNKLDPDMPATPESAA